MVGLSAVQNMAAGQKDVASLVVLSGELSKACAFSTLFWSSETFFPSGPRAGCMSQEGHQRRKEEEDQRHTERIPGSWHLLQGEEGGEVRVALLPLLASPTPRCHAVG